MAIPNLIRCREKEKLLSAEYIHSILDYNPETGEFRWKWRNDIENSWNAKYAGTLAGYKMQTGYILMCINYKKYLAHRLAWFYFYKEWPFKEIDHINNNKTDNRISNLRHATHHENNRNIKKRRNNTSGYKGVSYNPRNKNYVCRIKVNNNSIHLGCFNTPEEAYGAYCKAAKEYHGEFARF